MANSLTTRPRLRVDLDLAARRIPASRPLDGFVTINPLRDLEDRTTEYGGLLFVKRDGSPEIVECIPRVKGSDVRFEAPQAMFDQGYTGLFHFHLHAQSYENERYAGPHIGDFSYADSTRANCLVFTFLRRRELNVDYYRHGPVVVDLGSVTRPDAGK